MRLTLEEVINRHKEANPNTDYDYSMTVLGKTIHDKIVIGCKEHGVFMQAPHEHMKGQGCPFCAVRSNAIKKTCDVNQFIEIAREKFGDRFMYDVDKMNYVKMKAKCNIFCNKHSRWFSVTPINHLKSMSGGCPDCLHNIKINQDLFREKQEKKNRLIQKRIEREKKKEEALRIKEENRLRKELKKAKKERQKLERVKRVEKEKEERFYNFIEKAKKVHGNRYDYSYIKSYITGTLSKGRSNI